jgi:hypothetical protein
MSETKFHTRTRVISLNYKITYWINKRTRQVLNVRMKPEMTYSLSLKGRTKTRRSNLNIFEMYYQLCFKFSELTASNWKRILEIFTKYTWMKGRTKTGFVFYIAISINELSLSIISCWKMK